MDKSDYKKRKVNNDDIDILLSLSSNYHQEEEEEEEQEQRRYEPPEPYHFSDDEDSKDNNDKENNTGVKKEKNIYYFTYDIYKIGKNGSKPGKDVFLTKDCRYNPDDNEFEWKVKEIINHERASRKRMRNNTDSTWFEKEHNLIKKTYCI